MRLTQKLSVRISELRKKDLCPSFLNFNFRKYTFWQFLNDVFVGVKSFFLIVPIAIVFAIFSGGSPIVGLISVITANIVSAFLGGSKYQINSVAWCTSIIYVNIFTFGHYKGTLIVSIIVAIILIIFAGIRLGNLLKYTSKTFLTAIYACIALIMFVTQSHILLGIPITYSYQNFFGNCTTLFLGLQSVSDASLYLYLIFIGSLAVLKIFFKSFTAYVLYLIMWGTIMWCDKIDLLTLPNMLSSVTTIGQSFFQDLNRETIFNVSSLYLSCQSAYSDLVLYAFAVALLIGCQVCSSVGVAESFTGDVRIQTNMELISVGIANFLSVAMGGLFVSPDTDLTAQCIKNKSKSVITLLTISFATYVLLCLKDYIFRYIPILAISTILTYMSFHILHQCISSKYLNLAKSDSQIFFSILFVALEFGLFAAIVVGIMISLMQFTDRLIKINEPSVHSMQLHDSSIIEFVSNKYGYLSNKHIPNAILNKIEVVHLEGILSINQLDSIAATFISRGEFPSVIIIYFKNVPFFDSYSLENLKRFVKTSRKNHAVVLVTGTNGLLLDILKNKAKGYNAGNIFGHIVPNFSEAERQTLYRLGVGSQHKKATESIKSLSKSTRRKTAG